MSYLRDLCLHTLEMVPVSNQRCAILKESGNFRFTPSGFEPFDSKSNFTGTFDFEAWTCHES
jgi:hypothetical protein